MNAAPLSTHLRIYNMLAVYRPKMPPYRKTDCKMNIWTGISEDPLHHIYVSLNL